MSVLVVSAQVKQDHHKMGWGGASVIWLRTRGRSRNFCGWPGNIVCQAIHKSLVTNRPIINYLTRGNKWQTIEIISAGSFCNAKVQQKLWKTTWETYLQVYPPLPQPGLPRAPQLASVEQTSGSALPGKRFQHIKTGLKMKLSSILQLYRVDHPLN